MDIKTFFRDLFKINWGYKTYQVWLINTTIQYELYQWDNWRLLLPALNRLVGLTQEQAFIRTFQGYNHESKWLGFGRMKWNEANNIKWTTKYRSNSAPEQQPDFFNTEIWAPDWNKVNDKNFPPDIFINLYHNPTITELREGLTIALPLSLYEKNKLLIDQSLQEILSHIPGAKIHNTQRDWWGRVARRNNIEDMGLQEMAKIVGSE